MSLDTFNLNYEELPTKKYKLTDRIKKMGNTEVKQAKIRRVYEKTRGEHFKDIVIAVLITGVIAFIAGANYQGNQAQVMQAAISKAQAQIQPVKK